MYVIALRIQPYAFESREFLRKLVIGKAVAFKIVHQAAGGREYGTLTVEGADVASAVVASGWARARVSNKGGAGDADGATRVKQERE